MYTNIKAIILLFENCTESNMIPLADVLQFDFTAKVTPYCILADTVRIELKNNANQYFTEFGEKSEQTLFRRLDYPDIVGIDIIHEDDTHYTIAVEWCENHDHSDFANCKQTTIYTENGILITVA